MKNLLVIFLSLFSLSGITQETTTLISHKQVFIAGEGEDATVYSEREDEVQIIFRFDENIIEQYHPGRENPILTFITSVEHIREDIYEYRGKDEANTPITIQTYCDEKDNIVDVRVYFWSLNEPGEEDDEFICISHEI
jgi:hypothetical protein